MNADFLFTGTIGVGGTVLAFRLSNYSGDAATLAGLMTAAWMARQIWLSFQKPKGKK